VHGNWGGLVWDLTKLAELGFFVNLDISTADMQLANQYWSEFIQGKQEPKCAPYVAIVFTGDLVDRGDFGVEVMYAVYSLMAQQPDHIFPCLGNHDNNPDLWFRKPDQGGGFYKQLRTANLTNDFDSVDQEYMDVKNSNMFKCTNYIPLGRFLVLPTVVFQCHHGMGVINQGKLVDSGDLARTVLNLVND
jgi:hypothetical protein